MKNKSQFSRESYSVKKNRNQVNNSRLSLVSILCDSDSSNYFNILEATGTDKTRLATREQEKERERLLKTETPPETQEIIDILKKDEKDISDEEKKKVGDFNEKYSSKDALSEIGLLTIGRINSLGYTPKFNKISREYQDSEIKRASSDPKRKSYVSMLRASEEASQRSFTSATTFLTNVVKMIKPYGEDLIPIAAEMINKVSSEKISPKDEDKKFVLEFFYDKLRNLVNKENKSFHSSKPETQSDLIIKIIKETEQLAISRAGLSKTPDLLKPMKPEKASLLSRIKSIFSENYSDDNILILEQIFIDMINHGHIKNTSDALHIHGLIREMLEDNEHMNYMDHQDHMDDMEHMGPSETGVFDAPDEEHPGYMLLGNLKKLAVKAGELADLASPWDDAEPWIESKINSAAEHIDAIHDYIMYSVLDQDFDALGHEQMMYECGEMMGDVMVDDGMHDQVMTEPHTHGRHFGDGGSAQMARGQLFLIAKKAQSLSDRLSDDDTLPEWLQSKIAMAYQTIAMISDYMEYKMNYQDSPHAV